MYIVDVSLRPQATTDDNKNLKYLIMFYDQFKRIVNIMNVIEGHLTMS